MPPAAAALGGLLAAPAAATVGTTIGTGVATTALGSLAQNEINKRYQQQAEEEQRNQLQKQNLSSVLSGMRQKPSLSQLPASYKTPEIIRQIISQGVRGGNI
jgi:uncharacterized membrane protein YebE (DUF533 family)